MTQDMKLYLFGDQTFDLQPHLKDLLQNRKNPVLEDFLTKAYNALRAEIHELPLQAREDLPRFTCVDDMILWNQNGRRFIPLDMAITSLYQLGMFISQAEPVDFASDKCRTLGLCTGALAAAAVACSRSALDLVPLAIDAVVFAFRTGMHVVDASLRISCSEESEQSWSVVIPGSSSADTIHEFRSQTVSPSSY